MEEAEEAPFKVAQLKNTPSRSGDPCSKGCFCVLILELTGDVDELDELIVLITEMMDAIPRWEHNGWSPKELAVLREGER